MIRSEMVDVSAWTSVFGVLPFEEHEQAMWALRIRYRDKACVHTLDLFGPRLTEEYRLREELHKTRKDVFSAPKVGADGALDILLYRDAIDRTERKTAPCELSDLLAHAGATGAQALVRACLYRGFDLPGEAAKTTIVQSYYAKCPDELPKWEDFMEPAESHNALESLGVSMSVGVSAPERPQELGTQKPQEQNQRPFAYSSVGETPRGAACASGVRTQRPFRVHIFFSQFRSTDAVSRPSMGIVTHTLNLTCIPRPRTKSVETPLGRGGASSYSDGM